MIGAASGMELLLVAVVVLCVDIISSSSVMMEEDAGVDTFDSGGGRGGD